MAAGAWRKMLSFSNLSDRCRPTQLRVQTDNPVPGHASTCTPSPQACMWLMICCAMLQHNISLLSLSNTYVQQLENEEIVIEQVNRIRDRNVSLRIVSILYRFLSLQTAHTVKRNEFSTKRRKNFKSKYHLNYYYIGYVVLFTGWFSRCIRLASWSDHSDVVIFIVWSNGCVV